MKTLADFKRDLVIGRKMILKYRWLDKVKTNIGIERFVVSKNTTGVQLSACETAPKGSFLGWPKASLLEYDGKTATIYNSGSRPLTEKEKEIIAGEPRDEKQEEIDIMTDGSTMYYRKKRYYLENKDYEYLAGWHRQAGKLLRNGLIDDDDCKGEIGLVYEILPL
jgi:hypothetical protein